MQLEVYREASGFDALAKEWNALLHRSATDTIFLSHEWQRTWWQFFAGDKELLLLAAREKEELIGIAPFYVKPSPDEKRIIQLIGGTDISDYLDILAPAKDRERVYAAIFDFLTTRFSRWDELDLHCVPETSPLEPLRRAAAQHGLAVERRLEDVCPIVPLPETWEDYLDMLDGKQRHELRRKIRRAEGRARVDWYLTGDRQELHQDVEDFFELHRKSSPDKDDFMSDPAMQGFFHAMAEFCLEKGWLELSFILINDEKAASMFCFSYNDETLVYNSGYDPQKYAYLSPGIVLLCYHVQDSIDKGRTAFDFLRGDETYKYRMGGQDLKVFQITVRPGR
jgi:CelD/BcsL family acetyltransferase involved in cellulose biosynthesis